MLVMLQLLAALLAARVGLGVGGGAAGGVLCLWFATFLWRCASLGGAAEAAASGPAVVFANTGALLKSTQSGL